MDLKRLFSGVILIALIHAARADEADPELLGAGRKQLADRNLRPLGVHGDAGGSGQVIFRAPNTVECRNIVLILEGVALRGGALDIKEGDAFLNVGKSEAVKVAELDVKPGSAVVFKGGRFDPLPMESGKAESGRPDGVTFEEFAGSLVTIETLDGAGAALGGGSGFIGRHLGKPAVFSNIHVLGGLMARGIRVKTLAGKEIPVRDVFVAEGGADIAVFAQDVVESGLEVAEGFEGSVGTGDGVVVLGNSQGAMVATEILGKIDGVGPDRIEVDAEFVKGNSGSPVIHQKSKKVLGIAAYAEARKEENFVGKNTPFDGKVRRFAWRIDSVPAWSRISFMDLARQNSVVDEIERRTDLLSGIRSSIERGGTSFGVSLDERKLAEIVGQYLREIERPNRNTTEYLKAKKDFCFWLQKETEYDIVAARRQSFCGFLKARLEAQRMARDGLKMQFRLLSDRATPSRGRW